VFRPSMTRLKRNGVKRSLLDDSEGRSFRNLCDDTHLRNASHLFFKTNNLELILVNNIVRRYDFRNHSICAELMISKQYHIEYRYIIQTSITLT
jgi:hypothetical protein